MCCSRTRRLHLSRHPQNVCWKLLNSCMLLLIFAQIDSSQSSDPSATADTSRPVYHRTRAFERTSAWRTKISLPNLDCQSYFDRRIRLRFDKCSINARFLSYLQGIVSETSNTPQRRRQNRIQWNSILHDGSTKDRLFVFSANTHGALANQFHSHTVINCTLFIALVKRLKGPSVQRAELTICRSPVSPTINRLQEPPHTRVLCTI